MTFFVLVLTFPRADILTACASSSRWDPAFYLLASDPISLHYIPFDYIGFCFTELDSKQDLECHPTMILVQCAKVGSCILSLASDLVSLHWIPMDPNHV